MNSSVRPAILCRLAAALIVTLVAMGSGCGRADVSVTSPVAAPTQVATSAPALTTPLPTTPLPTTPLSTTVPGSTVPGPTVPGPTVPGPTVPAPTPTVAPNTAPSLADKIVSLPSVVPGLPEQIDQAVPVRLQVPSIGVDARIVAVGVDPNGDFDVPPADQVGWYQFGVVPGQPGSAVLAAHIAYNGADGVFRSLDDVEPGESVLVTFDDGSTVDLISTAQGQYAKDELPDDLFARSGEPRVVLITCGGDFNRGLSSYEDNVVAFATPVL